MPKIEIKTDLTIIEYGKGQEYGVRFVHDRQTGKTYSEIRVGRDSQEWDHVHDLDHADGADLKAWATEAENRMRLAQARAVAAKVEDGTSTAFEAAGGDGAARQPETAPST